MYVGPLYCSLKDEILFSGFVNVSQWKQHWIKGKEYMETRKVKNMKYGYNRISFDSILCIILYCDTNELQQNMSSTFRRKYQFETIDELKKRHAK